MLAPLSVNVPEPLIVRAPVPVVIGPLTVMLPSPPNVTFWLVAKIDVVVLLKVKPPAAD